MLWVTGRQKTKIIICAKLFRNAARMPEIHPARERVNVPSSSGKLTLVDQTARPKPYSPSLLPGLAAAWSSNGFGILATSSIPS